MKSDFNNADSPKNTKRVLIIVGRMHYGGIETMIMNFYRYIDRTKIKFDFMLNYSEPGIFDRELKELGCEIYILPRLRLRNFLSYPRALHKFFKSNQHFDLIHGHLTSCGPIYAILARLHGIKPVIIHSHATTVEKTLKGSIERALIYLCKYSADYFFACSKTAGEFAFGADIIKKPNFKLIKNAIVPEHFIFNQDLRIAGRRELGLENHFVVGHVGRFTPQKNHKFLIEIFVALKKICSEAVLVMVGSGFLENEIKSLTAGLDLGDSVRFLGFRDDVNKLLQTFDVFVLPSLYEGLPVVGVEAQAAGLPCFFSDVISEETNITGLGEFIGLDKSPEYWAEKIAKFAKGYKRGNMLEEIRKAGYDIREEAKKLEMFYLDVTENS